MGTDESHTRRSNDPVIILAERFEAGIRRAFPELEGPVDPAIQPSKQVGFGDFQCNAAMALSKRVGMKPREIAAKIVAEVDISDLAEPLTGASIAGPGFINITLSGEALARLLAAMDTPELGVTPTAEPKHVVVDLLGVNLAKQMHVGHLRSPFIGDAIARVFERLGHKVTRQNHVGDWGLPIAMVTNRLMKLAAAGKIDLKAITLDDLDRNYKIAQLECQRDMAGLEAVKKFGLGPKAAAELEEQVAGATEAFNEARQTLVKLQRKEPETYAVWKRIADITMNVCLAAAERLNVAVNATHSAGESSYADELPDMVQDLVSRGVAEEDNGALIVRLEDPHFGGLETPCLIRKSDGGYLYATTDICAVRRRVQRMHADMLIYAIDARQSLHMKQVFGASLKAGYAVNPETGKPAAMMHAAFGAVLGEDGRPFKTRSGESVNLQALIDEAVARAAAEIRSRNAELSDGDVNAAAEVIGVAAMKYADLRNDRIKDYIFSFDRMLSFEGDTGAYLQYAYARIKNIFRKAQERGVGAGWDATPLALREPAEKSLAMAILRYPATLHAVAESAEPHRLCNYIYELASAFSVFYDRCPVIAAKEESLVRERLALCDLTRRVLEDALHAIGIPTVDRM